MVKAVDGCKTSAVPPQPNGIRAGHDVPATTVPPPTARHRLPPTHGADDHDDPVYVPDSDHRRDPTYLAGRAPDA